MLGPRFGETSMLGLQSIEAQIASKEKENIWHESPAQAVLRECKCNHGKTRYLNQKIFTRYLARMQDAMLNAIVARSHRAWCAHSSPYVGSKPRSPGVQRPLWLPLGDMTVCFLGMCPKLSAYQRSLCREPHKVAADTSSFRRTSKMPQQQEWCFGHLHPLDVISFACR